MDLCEVGNLGETFDLIKCTGVLHHMEAPAEGLKALRSVLSAKGVLHGMVYAANRRVGVYLLQDVFRRLGLQQNTNDIRVARDIIDVLPEHHYFHWLRRTDGANEFANDAAFVDLLFHSRDRAFSVPEVLALISDCGLAFQDWDDNRYYYADTHFGSGSRIAHMLRKLPEPDQWVIVDNLLLQALQHSFLACHPEQCGLRRIGFDRDEFFDCFPLRRPELQIVRDGSAYAMVRGSLRYRLTATEHFIVKLSDGTRSVREIIANEALASHSEEARMQFAREFYRRMWQRGHIFLSRIKSPASPAPS